MVHEVDEQAAPNLYHVVEDMAMVAQIPMPRVFIVDDPSMNAFATGSSPVCSGCYDRSATVMNREELWRSYWTWSGHIHLYDIRIVYHDCLSITITMLAGMARNMIFWGGGRRRNGDDRKVVVGDYSSHYFFDCYSAPLAASSVGPFHQREFTADI